MKKILALAMVLGVFGVILGGCGSKTEEAAAPAAETAGAGATAPATPPADAGATK